MIRQVLDSSSAVEQSPVKRQVAGSKPAYPANLIPENRIDLFCACAIAFIGAFAIAKWVI